MDGNVGPAVHASIGPRLSARIVPLYAGGLWSMTITNDASLDDHACRAAWAFQLRPTPRRQQTRQAVLPLMNWT
jgi:hypothetical protein